MPINNKALQQAQSLHQQGNFDEALKSYLELHQKAPEDITLTQLLCLLYVQTGELNQAETLLKKTLKRVPTEPSLFNSLGNIYARLKQPKQAIQAYKKALHYHADYPGALNNLGNCYLQLDDTEQAKQYYRQAIDIDPDYPDAHFNLARLLFQERDFKQAKEQLTTVIAIAPKHAAALGLLGKLYLEENEPEKAIDYLQQRLAIQPHHADNLHAIACANLQLERFDEAIPLFEQALTLNPNIENGEHQLASAYLIKGDHQEALKHYLRQLKQGDNLETLYNVGVIYSDLQRHSDAIEHFQQALSLAPNHIPTYLNLGAIYLKKGDIKSAITHYQKALKLDPNNPEIQHILHALTEDATPKQAPKEYLQNLFDQYAPSYDKHLTEFLKYQTPEKLHQMVIDELNPKDHSLKILDLGCGTGLSGELFKPQAEELIGVDISSAMIDEAKTKNIYQSLLVDTIDNAIKQFSNLDLVIAADVFPYIGDLTTVFAGVFEALKSKGYFAFSVEKTLEDNYILQKQIRYAHHRDYVESLSKDYQFTISSCNNTILREQKNISVEGYLFLLQKL